MLWGIDTEAWAQLWSGVIGSFVAAVIGGLTALFVVRLTNRQQRDSAREAREILAMAELVAATAAMVKKYREGPNAIQDLLLTAEAAAIRWDIDSQVEEVGEEIFLWPYLLGNLSVDAFQAVGGPTGRTTFLRLAEAQTQLLETVSSWPKETNNGRKKLVEGLIEKRQSLEESRPTEGRDAPPPVGTK